jgi:DHA1 family multidrug resistance protein-like MFS transporter
VTAAADTGEAPTSQQTDWSQLALICFASFVVWSGFGAILPYLPVFLHEQAHASVRMIGVIAAMYYAGTFIFSSPLGRLSDRIGRKPVVVMGLFLYALATLLFVTTVNAWWFLLFRLCEGVGAASVGPAGSAIIADISNDDTRGRAYGLLTSAQFGGLVIGPALAVVLNDLGGGDRNGFSAIFLVGSAMTLAMALLVLALFNEPARAVARRRAVAAERTRAHDRAPFPLQPVALIRRLRRELARTLSSYFSLITPPVAAFLLVAATSHFAMGGWEVLWSLWLRHLGASMAFVSLTWIAFSVPMLFSFAGGMLAEKGNRFRLMFAGYAFSACSWIVYGFTRNLTIFLLFNVFEGVAVAISMPAKQAFLVQCSPRRWLGTIQGMEQTSMQLAALVGTLTAPFLFTWISGDAIGVGGFLALGGLACAAPVLSGTWKRIAAGGEALSLAEAERLAPPARGGAFGDERAPTP